MPETPRRCSGPTCGAEVVFRRSARSEKMLVLDAKPKKGIVLVDGVDLVDGILSPIHEGPLGDARAMVVNVWTDHHGTCPDVRSFPRRS